MKRRPQSPGRVMGGKAAGVKQPTFSEASVGTVRLWLRESGGGAQCARMMK